MTSLGLRDESSQWPVSRLIDYLASKRLLLVLDNCEHLLDACAVLADAVLREAPSLRILATSRQPLGIAGETVVQVGPLSVPDDEGKLAPDRDRPVGGRRLARRAGKRGWRGLRGDPGQPGRRGRARASTRRDPAGDRACSSTTSHAWPRPDGRAPERPLPSACWTAAGPHRRASKPSKPPSPGVTICLGRMNKRSCAACPCSPVRSASRRREGGPGRRRHAGRRVRRPDRSRRALVRDPRRDE